MDNTYVLAAVLLLAVLAVPFVHAAARGERVNLFSPPVLLAVAVFVGYLVPIPSYVAETDIFSRDYPMALADKHGSIARALFCVAGGMLAWQLGYFVLAGVRFRRRGPEPATVTVWKPRRLAAVVVWYSVAAVSLFAVGVYLLGGVTSLISALGDRLRAFTGLNYFIQSPNLMVAAALLWWIRLMQVRRPWTPSFWVFLGITVMFTALLGNKSNLLVIAIAGGVLYDQLYRRIPRRMVLLGGVVAFMGLMFYAMYIREYRRVGHFTTLGENGVTASSLLKRMDMELGGNFMQLQNLTIVVDRVPDEMPFQRGRTYMALISVPVPRRFWPGKPLPSTGIYTLAFWPDRWLLQGTTMPPGVMAEMYMNFGAAGVVLGMLLAGVLMGRANRAAHRPGARVTTLALNALVIAFIPHYVRGESMGATTWLLMMFLPLYAASKLVVRRRVLAGPAEDEAEPAPEPPAPVLPPLAPAPGAV